MWLENLNEIKETDRRSKTSQSLSHKFCSPQWERAHVTVIRAVRAAKVQKLRSVCATCIRWRRAAMGAMIAWTLTIYLETGTVFTYFDRIRIWAKLNESKCIFALRCFLMKVHLILPELSWLLLCNSRLCDLQAPHTHTQPQIASKFQRSTPYSARSLMAIASQSQENMWPNQR